MNLLCAKWLYAGQMLNCHPAWMNEAVVIFLSHSQDYSGKMSQVARQEDKSGVCHHQQQQKEHSVWKKLVREHFTLITKWGIFLYWLMVYYSTVYIYISRLWMQTLTYNYGTSNLVVLWCQLYMQLSCTLRYTKIPKSCPRIHRRSATPLYSISSAIP